MIRKTRMKNPLWINRGSKEGRKSAHAEEHGQKVDDLEDQSYQEFNIGNDDVTPVREAQDDDIGQWNPSSSPTPDREWHKTKTVDNKLTNLNLEERYVLNVALRMFTRRIVIQERVQDLQQGVKSYQKKINLERPDSYHLDLRRMTAYTAYPDIQGIIYKDELNRKRLMCIR
ncbi:hypothetical protein Tco_1195831 [Tanacetum coccineum]